MTEKNDVEEFYEQALSAMRAYSGVDMGYQPQHPKHKKGKPCYVCIERLEIEVGIRQPPRPPKGPGAVSPRREFK